MFTYHDTHENHRRLKLGICRCGSQGKTYDLKELLHTDKIKDPRNKLINLTTSDVRSLRSDPEPEGGGYGKTFIFAVSKRFEIRIAPDSDRSLDGSVKHETLFHNEDVLAAGEISIQDGIITKLNDISGSYRTDAALEVNPLFARAVLNALDENKLPVTLQLTEQLQQLSL